jgi:hypothetical protein
MKTNPATLPITVLLSATVLFGDMAFSQPTDNPPASARINPATGLPVSDTANPPSLDPSTGLPASQPGGLTPEAALHASYKAGADVHKLIFNGRYDEALQRCLAFHDQFKTSGSLIPLLSDWIELGRRFPKAKEALIEIRDHDVREFSEGRGYFDLFSEINSINGYLHQDDATYELFKSIREKDPGLAQQCYPFVEGLLVARGEYQWCYDHMGDPQGKFGSIHQSFTMQLDSQKRLAESVQQANQRLAEMNQKLGRTNTYAPPDNSAMMRKSAENGFVGQSCQLIEILVATGHKTDAETIRDQAVTILDNARLKSAVSDAEQKIAQLNGKK